MPKIAGFHCEIDHQDAEGPVLVLLHGSGQDEDAWLGISQQIAPRSPIVRLRGNIVWEGKYAFFRRRPDRSLDLVDLARSANELVYFIENLADVFPDRHPVLGGYSNGAIVAAAVARDAPGLTRGAILMRALSRDPASPFPPMSAYPVLIVTGADDRRREPGDGETLAGQFRAAGAMVDHHVLACGHGWDETGADVAIARQWLDQIAAAPPPR